MITSPAEFLIIIEPGTGEFVALSTRMICADDTGVVWDIPAEAGSIRMRLERIMNMKISFPEREKSMGNRGTPIGENNSDIILEDSAAETGERCNPDVRPRTYWYNFQVFNYLREIRT